MVLGDLSTGGMSQGSRTITSLSSSSNFDLLASSFSWSFNGDFERFVLLFFRALVPSAS